MNSDVTAVLLTTGEATFEGALASARAQTYELAGTVVVRGVSPFYQAFNEGVAAVRTPFFVQVDADMVLDPTCVARLRELMVPGVGVVAGLLRDPLLGRVPAVKLFRAACFEEAPLPDTIAPEVDHYRAGHLAGWLTLYALRNDHRSPAAHHTFGEHRPDYTPAYTYATYFLLGSRYRYLAEVGAVTWRRRELAASSHPSATLARLALGRGVFFEIEQDTPKSQTPAGEVEFVQQLLHSPERLEAEEREFERSISLPPPELFEKVYEVGGRLGRAAAGGTLRRCLEIVGRGASDHGWLAEAALAHGLFARGATAPSSWEAFAMVAPLLRGR